MTQLATQLETLDFPTGTLSGATTLNPVDPPGGMWPSVHAPHHTYHTYIASATGVQAGMALSIAARPVPSMRVDGWLPDRLRDAAWILDAVNSLRGLGEGWDGRHALPVTEAAAMAALAIAVRLVDGHHLLPQIFPLPDGGLQLEWHVFNADVEIEVDGSGAPFGVATDAAGQALWEREFGVAEVSALDDLGRFVAKMAHNLEFAR